MRNIDFDLQPVIEARLMPPASNPFAVGDLVTLNDLDLYVVAENSRPNGETIQSLTAYPTARSDCALLRLRLR